MFSFENLEVYNRSLKFYGEVEELLSQLKGRVSFSFLDQLSRASLSIPLNIAEGNGRWHKKEKKNFFWIARGSAFEVIPIFQILRNNGQISEERYESLYLAVQEISKMLYGLILAVDKIPQKTI